MTYSQRVLLWNMLFGIQQADFNIAVLCIYKLMGKAR
jgi:hypothetical protein